VLFVGALNRGRLHETEVEKKKRRALCLSVP